MEPKNENPDALDEKYPMILNPDPWLGRKDTGPRRTPSDMKVSPSPQKFSKTQFEEAKLANSYSTITKAHPTINFRIASKGMVKNRETVTIIVEGIHVDSGAESDGIILVEHDVAAQEKSPDPAGILRIPITKSEDAAVSVYEDKPDQMNQPPLLAFTLQGRDNGPVNAGTNTDLDLIVTNPSSTAKVYIYRIAAAIPIGDSDHDIVTPGSEKAIKPVTAKNFHTDTADADDLLPETGAYALFAFNVDDRFSTDGYELAASGQLTFRLEKIQLTRTPGKATAAVTELTSTNKQYASEYRKSQLSLTKMHAGFFFDYFATDTPAVMSGERARLLWAAENVDHYKLYCDDKELSDPETQSQHMDTSRLTQTSGYILEAFSDEKLSHAQQAIATVTNPSVTLNNVTVKNNLNLSSPAYTHSTTSYAQNTDQGKEKKIIEAANGDRYVIIGLSEPDNQYKEKYKPSDQPPPGLIVTTSKGPAPKPDTLSMGPDYQPIALLLPAGASLSVTPNHSWKQWQESTLKAALAYAVSDPRVLPREPA
ncbi:MULTISPECIES: hypothetical protein [Streptomyces]|uniref:hypothetical protein n=1 Tax=Streptomyces TaxID=1883 RepID=UPI00345C3D99